MLAFVDESEPYSIDQCAIIQRGDEFILASASGCSCWDGTWDEEKFNSLDDLAASLLADDRLYNPSFGAARLLVAEAREALAEEQRERERSNG